MKHVFFIIAALSLVACTLAGVTPQVIAITATPEVKVVTATSPPATPTVARPTPTLKPRPSPTPACRNSSTLTEADIGSIQKVCGLIVDEGEGACDSCRYGSYSYLVLEGGFHVISYDWNFFSDNTGSWEGSCVQVVDKVEPFSGKTAFVFSKAEGLQGAECWTGDLDERICRGDQYFEFIDPSACE